MAREKWDRGPIPDKGERLNSPVNDPGFWPYDDLSSGLPDTVTSSRMNIADPMGFTPERSRNGKKE